jgi:hypothetical protein
VQDPACFTLHDWSPTEGLHLTSPAYKAGASLSVRDGQLVGRAGIAPTSLRLKAGLCLAELATREWCPTIELHDPPPGYESGAPLSELEGHVWCRWLDLLRTTNALHISMRFNGEWHQRSELNTRNPPSEGRRRSSVGVGMNWHP